jgi:hypothetical protein
MDAACGAFATATGAEADARESALQARQRVLGLQTESTAPVVLARVGILLIGAGTRRQARDGGEVTVEWT